MASFVNEEESDDRIDREFLPEKLLSHFLMVKSALRPFAKHMTAREFEVRPLFLRPAAAIYAWACGQSWESTISIAETAEGNLASLILRTADNLRHIRALSQIFPEAAETAARAIEFIMKEPVIMDYSL